MTIGERIKQRRLELGLTQTELAHRLGNKSRTSVCTVETNKEDLTTDRIRKYAEALETTPAYLMGWAERENFQLEAPIVAKPYKPDYKVVFKDADGSHEEFINQIQINENTSIYNSILTLSALLKDPSLYRLILAAEHSSPKQIQLAIEMLNAFKEGE